MGRTITPPPCWIPSSSPYFRKRKSGTSIPPTSYQASVYAWNGYRENKTITSVKYDTKKGLYTVAV
jgi:hypothetical protein